MRVAMVAFATYDGNSRIQQYANVLARRAIVWTSFVQKEATSFVQKEASLFVTMAKCRFTAFKGRRQKEESCCPLLVARALVLNPFHVDLARIHRRNRYDVIHVHSAPDFLALAALIPRLSGASVILDIHNILPEFFASKFGECKNSIVLKLLILVERMLIALADYVIIANRIWEKQWSRLSSQAAAA